MVYTFCICCLLRWVNCNSSSNSQCACFSVPGAALRTLYTITHDPHTASWERGILLPFHRWENWNISQFTQVACLRSHHLDMIVYRVVQVTDPRDHPSNLLTALLLLEESTMAKLCWLNTDAERVWGTHLKSRHRTPGIQACWSPRSPILHNYPQSQHVWEHELNPPLRPEALVYLHAPAFSPSPLAYITQPWKANSPVRGGKSPWHNHVEPHVTTSHAQGGAGWSKWSFLKPTHYNIILCEVSSHLAARPRVHILNQ